MSPWQGSENMLHFENGMKELRRNCLAHISALSGPAQTSSEPDNFFGAESRYGPPG